METEMEIVARYQAKAPVDLVGLAEELGIDLVERPIRSGESGWIERTGDQYRVVVNANEGDARKRFTTAHELAHYLLHRDLMDHGSRMNRHTDRLFDGDQHDDDSPFTRAHEVQANRMAARLIMPASLVRKKVRQGLSLAQLANDFEVSKAAMEIRLSTLGLTVA
jgi:Zn-dependent peptidase ImmA (M78 family)